MGEGKAFLIYPLLSGRGKILSLVASPRWAKEEPFSYHLVGGRGKNLSLVASHSWVREEPFSCTLSYRGCSWEDDSTTWVSVPDLKNFSEFDEIICSWKRL